VRQGCTLYIIITDVFVLREKIQKRWDSLGDAVLEKHGSN